jgi:hypothetical protein
VIDLEKISYNVPMIDLDKIGYNVLEKDGYLEVVGGMTLTVQVRISLLAPDKEAMIEHARKRIREKIWEMAYGHLREPMMVLKYISADPQMSGCPEAPAKELKKAVDMMEEAVGEP